MTVSLEAGRKIPVSLILSPTILPTISGLPMLSFPHVSCQKTKGSVAMMRKHKSACEPELSSGTELIFVLAAGIVLAWDLE